MSELPRDGVPTVSFAHALAHITSFFSAFGYFSDSRLRSEPAGPPAPRGARSQFQAVWELSTTSDRRSTTPRDRAARVCVEGWTAACRTLRSADPGFGTQVGAVLAKHFPCAILIGRSR